MTREDAKELKDKIYKVDFDYDGDDFIDKIYDDFENEKDELKDAQFAEERKALIDKACKWLKSYSQYRSDLIAKNLNEKFIDEFRKAVEEEKWK